MKHIDVSVAAERLPELIAALQPGEKLILTKNEQAVAKLSTVSRTYPRGPSLTIHLCEHDNPDEMMLAIYFFRVRTVPAEEIGQVAANLAEWLRQARRISEAVSVENLLEMDLPAWKLRRFLMVKLGWCPQCGVPIGQHACPHSSMNAELNA